jgi:hypothetical protein
VSPSIALGFLASKIDVTAFALAALRYPYPPRFMEISN